MPSGTPRVVVSTTIAITRIQRFTFASCPARAPVHSVGAGARARNRFRHVARSTGVHCMSWGATDLPVAAWDALPRTRLRLDAGGAPKRTYAPHVHAPGGYRSAAAGHAAARRQSRRGAEAPRDAAARPRARAADRGRSRPAR